MKKALNRFLGFILAIIITALIFAVNATATGTVISFSDKNLTVGETVTVTVTLNSGEAMYSVGCVINYDNNVIDYISGNASGGEGILKIVEAPSGETKVLYTLTFKAVGEGICTISVFDCKYATIGNNGAVEKGLTGASATLNVVSSQTPTIENGICGENVVWGVKSDGTLEINGKGKMFNYGTAEEVPWYKYANNINTIKIKENITYIGHYSFNCLENLKKVIVYNSDLIFSQYYVFSKSTKAEIYGSNNSTAEKYANENNIAFVLISNLVPPAPIINSVVGNNITLEWVEGYEYSNDGIVWQEDNVFTNVPFDTVQYFYQRKISNEISIEHPSSDSTKCIIVSPPKVLVGETSLKFIPIDGYRYSVNGIKYQTDNLFTELVPQWNYTVYQEPIDTDNIYVYNEYNKMEVCVNGTNKIIEVNSTHLVWLRKLLLEKECNELGADFNEDCLIDIRDLVNLKRKATYI